jgi:hypothetical protein
MHDCTSLQALDDVLKNIVRAAIAAFDTSLLVKPESRWYGEQRFPSDRMIDLVEFCFEVGAQSQCQHLLPRFVEPPTGVSFRQHASQALSPFLLVLHEYLVQQGLAFTAEPFKGFIISVLKAFAEQVMTEKPDEGVPVAEIETVGCKTCSNCAELRAFLLSQETSTSLYVSKPERTHLEHKLARTSAWGVLWDPGRGILKVRLLS